MSSSSRAIEHEFKAEPEHFRAIVSGARRADLRVNDVNFQVGELMRYVEFDSGLGRYTGSWAVYRITDVFGGNFEYGLGRHHVILSLAGPIASKVGPPDRATPFLGCIPFQEKPPCPNGAA